MSSRPTPQTRAVPPALILAATLALFVFYYLGRADVIATLSRGSGAAHAVTARPLGPFWHFVVAALVLGAFPTLVARYGLGLRLRTLGLGFGRWRLGLALLAVGIPLAIVAGRIAAASPQMRFVYPLDAEVQTAAASFIPYALLQFLYFAAWEVLFRGVLLFGLEKRLGGGTANAVQTALSVIAHFGRPLTETFAALPAGLVFGSVALRTRSIWYLAVIHWLVGVSMDWFILST